MTIVGRGLNNRIGDPAPWFGGGQPLGAIAAGNIDDLIQITTPAYLNPALMMVGEQIGAAFVPGVYPDFLGAPVSEIAKAYTVNGNSAASTYVLQSGDLVGQVAVTLAATGAPNRTYFSAIQGIVDFSPVPSNLLWEVPPGVGGTPAGITIVGTTTDDGPNGANSILDLTAISGLANGDLVLAIGAGGSGVDSPINVVAGTGWTRLAGDYFVNDTFKVNMSVWYKFMTGTPDASLTLQGANTSAGGGAGIAIALRGVDAVINDVAIVPASSANTALANPGAITPVTAGALIIAFGAASGDPTPVAFTGPANMTGFQQVQAAGSSRSITAFIALKTDWASGAFDPSPLTGGEDSTSCAYAAVTVALKPA